MGLGEEDHGGGCPWLTWGWEWGQVRISPGLHGEVKLGTLGQGVLATPSTPPLGKQNPGQAVSNPETAQPHAGTLPRPRPVPKPRNRPNVPPPPHPPGAHAAGDGNLSIAAPTASKIVTGKWEMDSDSSPCQLYLALLLFSFI